MQKEESNKKKRKTGNMAKMSYQAAKYSHQGKQTQTWGGQKKGSEN